MLAKVMSPRTLKQLTGLILSALLMSCVSMSVSNEKQSKNSSDVNFVLSPFERQVAERLMVSVRYFCNETSVNLSQCKQPVTKLPTQLKKLIRQTGVGGVVLFSENLQSTKQIIQLTSDLQTAALSSVNGKPLFIAIDQEGGRVARLPREQSTGFNGNMAIGATYPTKGTHYANEVGKIIGKELSVLGINVNFSPDVDINNNPDNPVINVRSFGEQPIIVSKLGVAMLNAIQSQKIIATLKHFPGHGNTSVDSHTGLPKISYDRKTFEESDLIPFKNAIEQSTPGMIMTAHIQYPNLDQQTMQTKKGEEMIVPATMSKKILTQLLRKEMQFDGIIITDALNMAGISKHFSLEDATATSLNAGADIALMPYRIREPKDIEGFVRFIKSVAKKLKQEEFDSLAFKESLARIERLKASYELATQVEDFSELGVAALVKNADALLANNTHRKVQKQLAEDSLTIIKHNQKLFPLSETLTSNIHLIVQDTQQLFVITKAIRQLWSNIYQSELNISFTILAEYRQLNAEKKIQKADTIIAFYSQRRDSAVVKGEVDDIDVDSENSLLIERERLNNILESLKFAKQNKKNVIVAGMQSPYEMRPFLETADSIIVAYDPSIYKDKETGEYKGVTYQAVISVLFGIKSANGKLPVKLE